MLTILLVEDQPIDARIFCSAVAQCNGSLNATVRVAHNVAEAEGMRPQADLIVADLFLPDSLPDQTMEVIREWRRHCPVLILSGNLEPDRIMQAGRWGVGYLHKGTATPEVIEIELLWQLGAWQTRRKRCAMLEESARVLSGSGE